MRRVSLAFVVFAALAAWACAHANLYRPADAPSFAKIDPDSVSVYDSLSQLPCADTVRVGEVEGSGDVYSGRDKIVGKMREEAAKVGANAILLLGYSGTSLFHWYNDAKARAVAYHVECSD